MALVSCQKTKKAPPKYQHMVIDSIAVKAEEMYRPVFHFTPKENWMNDPNGMVYYQGEYHLFYQYYPDDTVWGPMHWGHAVSKDMIHWQRLPIAIYPDEKGYIFSGSCVVDWNNTSGLGSKQNPPMIAIYTYHDPEGEKSGEITFQSQAIAYSLDKGRTWSKYEGNPVIPNPGIRDFRDPKVIWHRESKQWVMVLAVKDSINFYSSKNLKDWQLESEFKKQLETREGVWECPDLFSLIDQDGHEKWVLLVSVNSKGPQGGSATQYLVGNFDGNTFLPDHTETKWVDFGADNYAGVTFSDIPNVDGRRLFMGWMSNWQYAQVVPTEKWRSAMTIPRELTLKKMGEKHLLCSKPVQEMEAILKPSKRITENEYRSSQISYAIEIDETLTRASIRFSNELDESFTIAIENGEIVTDRTQAGKNTFSKDFGVIHKAQLPFKEISNVKLFVDTSSVELFVNDGAFVMTELLFPTTPLSIISTKGIHQFKFSAIQSIWK